jgi:hypothetical protein
MLVRMYDNRLDTARLGMRSSGAEAASDNPGGWSRAVVNNVAAKASNFHGLSQISTRSPHLVENGSTRKQTISTKDRNLPWAQGVGAGDRHFQVGPLAARAVHGNRESSAPNEPVSTSPILPRCFNNNGLRTLS